MIEDEKARRYLRTMGESEAPDAKRQRMERCPTDSWSSTTSYWKRQLELDRRQHQLLQQQLLQQQE